MNGTELFDWLQSVGKVFDEVAVGMAYVVTKAVGMQSEKAFRLYANDLNLTCPRRKVSWRRLNKHQQRAAIRRYIPESNLL